MGLRETVKKANAASREGGKRRSPEPGSYEAVDISPVGFAIVLIGALGMVIGVFLPMFETSELSLGGLKTNTLIQNGDGWIVLGLAVGIAAAAYRSYAS